MVNGGVVELGTGGASSRPGFLRAFIDGGDASAEARGALLYVDTATRRTLTWSADVRIQKRPRDGGAEILEITDLATNWYFSINLLSDRDQVFEDRFLPDGSFVVNTTPMGVTIPIGSWHRVAFRLDWSNKKFDVSVDGTSAADGPLIYAADSAKLQLAVGISYARDFGAVVDFDNGVATE